MKDTSAHGGALEKTSGRRQIERSERPGRSVAWRDVDRRLEVRSRLVVIADALEEGDVRLAELCLFQLLDDLDAAA